MSDERMQPLLEAWLKDREATPYDVRHSTSRVMARLPQVRQRGRWWPLPAFDRPVSTIPTRELAPVPIPATSGRQPARGFTMFSALKFVVAAVIVALFGGFLLAGVLTTPQDGEVPPAAVTESPSPMTTEELLSGMVTEEVEPGVYQVINEGVRDVRYSAVSVRPDGSMWRWEDDVFFRLGYPPNDDAYSLHGGPYPVVAPDGTYWTADTRMVLPDGTDWVSDEPPWDAPEGVREVTRLHSLEDGSWTVRAEAPDLDRWTIAPDGTVWAAYRTDGNVVARLGTDGWEPLEDPPRARGLVVTESGEVWVGGDPWTDPPRPLGGYLERRRDGSWAQLAGGSLWRYHEDDGAWQEVTVDAVVRSHEDQHVEIGPDGTVWFAGYEPLIVDGEPVPDPAAWHLDGTVPKLGDLFLMRFDGTEWQRWGLADGVPPLGPVSATTLTPTPDGGLWLSMHPYGDIGFEALPCPEQSGIAHFDGTDWHHFLAGHCVIGSYTHLAPDGSVWLMADPAGDEELHDEEPYLYVITPEAVAASE